MVTNTDVIQKHGELFCVIAGLGQWSMLGNGLHVYPNGNENHKGIYEACVELEEEGYIARAIDKDDHVLFTSDCKCGGEPIPNEVCPYADDLGGNKMCNCCKLCRRDCAWDV